HLARAKSLRLECSRDIVDQRVDYEHQPLRIGKRVIHPVHRRVRQITRHCCEHETIVIGTREPPQMHTLSTESNFDRFLLETRKITAALDSRSIEQVHQRRRWI